MKPDLVDFTLILGFAVIYPAYGAWIFKRRRAQIAGGNVSARRRTHYEAIVWQVAFVGLLGSLWLVRHRPFADLGIRMQLGLGFWAALFFTAVIIGFFVAQWRTVRRNDRARSLVRDALEPLRPILPHTPSEMKSFAVLSLTAGCCEELLFRGYLIWVGTAFVGLWLAAVLSSLLFGYGHLYQSVGGMLKTAAVGLVAAMLYIMSGSIWLPMLLHALLDVVQGGMAFDVLRGDGTIRNPQIAST